LFESGEAEDVDPDGAWPIAVALAATSKNRDAAIRGFMRGIILEKARGIPCIPTFP
jgi:hypothetical protein